jgi:biofilm PGA synthesis N-glycosyltransferase PgaC
MFSPWIAKLRSEGIRMGNKSYALITAARNEEAYIGRTLTSVVEQTLLPKVWAIISDGSTDRTDEIAREYAGRYDFIRFTRLDNTAGRAFSNQAIASNAGYNQIKEMQFDFVGFLDADISFAPEYYEELLARFDRNPRLGVAGGQIVENTCGRYRPRPDNSLREVAGAVQCFLRECYEDIGGLMPLRWGGHDSVANAMARRLGWQVQTFADLDALHHRPTGTAGATVYRARFRGGMEDYFMGYHALYEVGKCVRRVSESPYLIGSVLRLCGYLWPGITGQPRTVPTDFVNYLKQQQLRRLFHAILGR